MIGRLISSLQHPTVKHLIKLRENKEYRHAQQHVLVSGIKIVNELPGRIKTLLIKENYTHPHALHADHVLIVSEAILKKVTGLPAPEPIAAEVAMPVFALLDVQKLLVLDGVSDPGNLGTLLRTALALGWQGAFLLPGCTDPYHEKALRASKGASLKLAWKDGSFEELFQLVEQEKMTLIAADLNAEPLSPIAAPIALVLGNESHGISEKIKKRAKRMTIPIHEMESLNVATAGAIFMFTLQAKQ